MLRIKPPGIPHMPTGKSISAYLTMIRPEILNNSVQNNSIYPHRFRPCKDRLCPDLPALLCPLPVPCPYNAVSLIPAGNPRNICCSGHLSLPSPGRRSALSPVRETGKPRTPVSVHRSSGSGNSHHTYPGTQRSSGSPPSRRSFACGSLSRPDYSPGNPVPANTQTHLPSSGRSDPGAWPLYPGIHGCRSGCGRRNDHGRGRDRYQHRADPFRSHSGVRDHLSFRRGSCPQISAITTKFSTNRPVKIHIRGCTARASPL